MQTKNFRLLLVSSMALFSMFFGAGNMIFPPTLGQWAGDQYPIAMLGFLVTSVGIVLLAVISTTVSGGNVEDNARPFGQFLSYLFGTAILLAIGPGLAIPRTAATTIEILDLAIWPGLNPVLSSVVFFAIVLMFTFNPTEVIDRLGRFLTPILLILLSAIILKGLLSPLDIPAPTAVDNVFGMSFEEGYQTMDGLAALAFATLIMASFRNNGVTEQKDLVRLTVRAGLIATIGLSLVYAGLLYIGATTSGMGLGTRTRVEMLFYICDALLGNFGVMFLAGAMALACLTTAIGLTSAVGGFFARISGGRIPYRLMVVCSTLFSIFFAVNGVERIVAISAPILVFIYPIAITLVFLNLLNLRMTVHHATYHGAVAGVLVYALVDGLENRWLATTFMENFRMLFPVSVHSFLWIVFALVFGVLFTLAYGRRKIG